MISTTTPTLRPYQEEGAAFLRSHARALLGDDMGLGKTPQACRALMPLDTTKPTGVVIVCPTSVSHQWRAELARWAGVPPSAAAIAQGRKPSAESLAEAFAAPVLILPYSVVESWIVHVVNHEREGYTLVVDEAHYCKSPQAKRTKAVYSKHGLAGGASRIWCLTGTPTPNRVREIATTALTLLPRGSLPIVPWSYTAFCERYGDPKTLWTPRGKVRVYDGASNVEELRTALHKHILLRRMKSDVLEDLPPKTRSLVTLGASGADKAAARHPFNREAVLQAVKEGLPTPDFQALSAYRHEDALATVDQAAEWIAEQYEADADKRQRVVWCHHVDVAGRLAAALREREVAAIDVTGGLPQEMRASRLQAFKARQYAVLVATIGSCGTGVDGLQCASFVDFVEPSYVPGENEQAEDRVCRFGQTGHVQVSYLVQSETFHAQILRVVLEKMAQINSVLKGEA